MKSGTSAEDHGGALSSPRREGAAGWCAAAGFLALAVAATWPLALRARTSVAGYLGVEDLQQTLWLFWWWSKHTENLLASASTLGWARAGLEFFRFPLEAGMGSFLDFVPTWPLGRLLGFPLYYNVKVLLVLALNGWSAWLLVRTVRPGAAWGAAAAGAAFLLCPLQFYHLGIGRTEQLVAFPMALFLVYLERSRREAGLGAPALAGAWLGLAGACYWFYGVFALMAAALWAVWEHRAGRPLPRPAQTALAAAVCLGVCSPFLYVYAEAARSGQFHDPRITFFQPFPLLSSLPRAQRPDFYAQILNASTSLDSFVRPVMHQYVPLALTLPALALLGADRRGRGVWGALALAFLVLSLGPYARWQGEPLHVGEEGLPLPYHLPYAGLPFFSKLNWPSRMLVPATLALAVWVGLGVEALPRRRVLASSAIAAGLLADLLVSGFLPVGMTPLQVPEFYLRSSTEGFIELPCTGAEALGAEGLAEGRPTGGAVVKLYRDLDLKNLNYLQIRHGKKALWGQARFPPLPGEPDPGLADERMFFRNSVLAWLAALAQDPDRPPAFREEDRRALLDRGYSVVVLHERGSLGERGGGGDLHRRMARALEGAFGAPLAADREGLWEAPPDYPGGALAVPFSALRFQSREVLFFDLEGAP